MVPSTTPASPSLAYCGPVRREWLGLGNGELIRKAEESGYHVIVTTDKNMRYQQNLKNRALAVVVLQSPA